MSKPRPPTPPSPTETAAAQTGVNIGTAVANTQMGQVNQVTPEGSLTYAQTGSQTYTDPSTGRTYAIPQYTATTALSADAQAIRDQNNAASLNLATLAANQSGRADQLLSQPFSLDSVPAGADRSQFGPASYGPGLATPQFSQGGQPLPQMGQGGTLPQGSTPSALPSTMQAGNLPQLSQASTLPQASQAGNLPQLSQGGALPQMAQAGNVPQFGSVGTSAGLQNTYTPEGGFSADRQRVEDALMGRLGTQRERDMEGLRTQLANQGIGIGTEAYSRALQDFERTNTDMRTSAILGSAQEQSRLLGEARAAGQFGNEARQTEFQNQLTGNQFNNQNAAQRYAMEEDRRRYGDQFGMSQFGMGEDQRRYDDAQRASQFGMGEDVRRYQDQFGMSQFGAGEDVRRYQDAQRAGLFGMGEDVRRYENQMGLTQYGLGEDARRYQDQMGLTRYGLGEDRSRYADQFGMAQYGMGEDARRYADAMAQQQFGNQQAIQGRGDQIAGAQFAQQQSIFDAQDNARARALQEQLALRNQPINEITALMSGSQVATPQFGIAQSAMIPTTDYAGIRQQGFGNQMANYQQQNANYQAMLGGLFGLGSAGITAGSDIRLKSDIEPMGERGGHNWYRFRYVWEDPGTVHEGVMAQEVMQTRPDAVSTHPMGFYVVDYAALGLEMV